jgi:hypothetical protein
MAKPRVFLSSTFTDLYEVRNAIKAFLVELGYEPVLFETGAITFDSKIKIDEACYNEVTACHLFVLLIGGEYGSPTSMETHAKSRPLKHYESITKHEFISAKEKGIPIFIFVKSQVFEEYQFYTNNKKGKNIKYKYVKNTSVFQFINEILKDQNFFLKPFQTSEDIKSWLRDQLAGLFCVFLSRRVDNIYAENLNSRIGELREINNDLRLAITKFEVKLGREIFQHYAKEYEDDIFKRKIQRFINEEIISFLINYFEVKLSAAAIYKEFESSNSVNEFIERINDSKNEVMQIAKFPGAGDEFKMLRTKYFTV